VSVCAAQEVFNTKHFLSQATLILVLPSLPVVSTFSGRSISATLEIPHGQKIIKFGRPNWLKYTLAEQGACSLKIGIVE
jgi:hypothetical protein